MIARAPVARSCPNWRAFELLASCGAMSVRPSSLPANCSRFLFSDSGEDPVNFRRNRLTRLIGTPQSVRTRRSGSLPSAVPGQPEVNTERLKINASPFNNKNLCFDVQDGASVIEANTTVLTECETKVIRFYHWSLTLIGWCPIRTRVGEIVNVFWTIFIVLCLFISYSYQVLVCQWDVPMSNITKPTSAPVNSSKMLLLDPSKTTVYDSGPQLPCNHLISLYLLPNFLHFIAYVIGCWHFRTSIELVEALTQKFFMSYPYNSKRKFVRLLRFYFYFSFLWAALSLVGNFVYEIVINNHASCKVLSHSGSICSLIWVIEVLGNCFSFNVSSVIAFNFVAQGEIVIANISGLLSKLQMRVVDLRDAMKDVCALKRNVALLNGAPSLMTSILTFITADLTITGAVMLTRLDGQMFYNFYYWMFVIRFLPVALFPVLQAVRVNKHCRKLTHAALEVRANGYREASMLDLDSFLLFAHTNKFHAKLFGLGFRGAHFTLASIFILSTYLCLAKPSFV